MLGVLMAMLDPGRLSTFTGVLQSSQFLAPTAVALITARIPAAADAFEICRLILTSRQYSSD